MKCAKTLKSAVPEIKDPVFAKTSPKRSFCMTENERIGLVFVKTGSINSGTARVKSRKVSGKGGGTWRVMLRCSCSLACES
jgi:hypothetical protein